MKKIELDCLVLGGSRGIGKSISDKLKIKNNVESLSSEELDTSNIKQITKFCEFSPPRDVMILNTGGPPAKDFNHITICDWNKYFNQLMLSMVLLLQKIEIRQNGFVFLISSHTIKSPQPNLVLSNSFRIALSSVFKTYSQLVARKSITCINIAPGPIKTKRLESLVDDIDLFANELPSGKIGEPSEIADFINSIIENKIKYMTGVTINFDGGLSTSIF